MANKKFEDYVFKPSGVIEGLNRWYEAKDEHLLIWFADPAAWPNPHFYDRDKTIDDAIRYLRGMDIFYAPGTKWDDVKFKLNAKACSAEYGFCTVHDAWPKVNPAIDQRKFRDSEIRDYILKRFDMNGIKIPESFRDPNASVENLIAYIFALLMHERRNKELAEEIKGQYRERNDRLHKKVEMWERLYKRQKKLMEEMED